MKQENTLYVGIDVASKTNAACFLNASGEPVARPFQFPNNQQGARALEALMIELGEKEKVRELKAATEATSFYDFHLADFLAESEKLLGFGLEVFRFNPKLVSRFKKALQETEKTDFTDALAIAKRLRFGDLPAPYSSVKDYLPLQRLTRYRQHLVREIIREKNFFLTHLFLKNSSLATERPIKRVLGATSRVIISEYLSSGEIAQAPLEELTSLIIRAGRNRVENPEKLARIIKQVSRESYRIRPSLAESLNLILASSMRTLRSYQESLKGINQAVESELAGLRQTLTSVKGIGPVFAAGIMAEIGELKRFRSPDALAKYAGLWWPRNQSGEFEAEERHLKKSGNIYLRYYLVEAANSLRVHNEEYKAFYEKKYREVRKHQHKRALVLTARKLVRLVYSLLKTSQLYRVK